MHKEAEEFDDVIFSDLLADFYDYCNSKAMDH